MFLSFCLSVCFCFFLSLSIFHPYTSTHIHTQSVSKAYYVQRQSVVQSTKRHCCRNTCVFHQNMKPDTDKRDTHFTTELSLCQPELCEIILIKVVIDIPFIRHFILAWPWVFVIIMAHMITLYIALA